LNARHFRLIIDLSEVGYMSSSGLRALLRARRQAQMGGGDVVLCAMNERVTEVFEMIGFNNLFRTFATPAEAAAALPPSVPVQH
jgi:anti-anti-sigma factor